MDHEQQNEAGCMVRSVRGGARSLETVKAPPREHTQERRDVV